MWNPELKISYIAFKEAHSDQNLPVAAIADLCGLHLIQMYRSILAYKLLDYAMTWIINLFYKALLKCRQLDRDYEMKEET